MNSDLCFLFKYIYRNANYSVLKESILLCVVQYIYIYNIYILEAYHFCLGKIGIVVTYWNCIAL